PGRRVRGGEDELLIAEKARRRGRRPYPIGANWLRIDHAWSLDASAPVVHPRVLHAEDRRLLVLQERGVDDLAEEQRVVADLNRLANLALDVRDRLRKHRRAGRGPVEIREVVERARREVDLDRLGELADDRAVLAIDQTERE